MSEISLMPVTPLTSPLYVFEQLARLWAAPALGYWGRLLAPAGTPQAPPALIGPADFEALRLGETAELSDTPTQEDTKKFSEVSKDRNRAHLDRAFMATTAYGDTIPHGMRMASLVSALIALHFGDGVIYEMQTLHFRRPSYHSIEATARVVVLAKQARKNARGQMRHRVALLTEVRQDDKVVISGRALIQLPVRA